MNEDEKDFLKFYMEQTWEEMRHIEGLRERVAIFLVTISSAIVGFVIQQKYSADTKPFALFTVFIGIFGILFAWKYYQIHKQDQNRLEEWYKYYELKCGNFPQVLALRTKADRESKVEFPIIKKIRHRYLWYFMNLAVVLVGLYLCYKVW
jgi:hypothetical protein